MRLTKFQKRSLLLAVLNLLAAGAVWVIGNSIATAVVILYIGASLVALLHSTDLNARLIRKVYASNDQKIMRNSLEEIQDSVTACVSCCKKNQEAIEKIVSLIHNQSEAQSESLRKNLTRSRTIERHMNQLVEELRSSHTAMLESLHTSSGGHKKFNERIISDVTIVNNKLAILHELIIGQNNAEKPSADVIRHLVNIEKQQKLDNSRLRELRTLTVSSNIAVEELKSIFELNNLNQGSKELARIEINRILLSAALKTLDK